VKRIRFNIASLLGVIFIFGVGIAALRESTDLWESGIFTLTLAALLISILLVVRRTEKRRAFWMGFAVFGWIYLALALMPSTESRLITTRALAYLDSKVPGRPLDILPTLPELIRFANVNRLDINRPDIVTLAKVDLLGGWSGTTENFMRIGHSLLALLAGWVGGQLSRRLCRTSRPAEDLPTIDVEGTIS
jgi:hypothetical protein